MEMYGFKKCLEYLLSEGFQIRKFVSDRHNGISSFMREDHPEIRHRFDLWHIAKSELLINHQFCI